MVDRRPITEADKAFGQRLWQIRDHMDISAIKFAKMFNVSRQVVYDWEGGRIAPNTARLNEIIQRTGVSADWLMTGNGSMFPQSPILGGSLRNISVQSCVEAGVWCENNERPHDEHYMIAMPERPEFKGRSLYGVEVRGPSMNRVYPTGTVLIVASTFDFPDELKHGRRYIIERKRPDGLREITVKTVSRDGAGNFWLIPESDDPRYQRPIPVAGQDGEEIAIVGLVIGSYRSEV